MVMTSPDAVYSRANKVAPPQPGTGTRPNGDHAANAWTQLLPSNSYAELLIYRLLLYAVNRKSSSVSVLMCTAQVFFGDSFEILSVICIISAGVNSKSVHIKDAKI
jgi:hypothetical protein